MLVIRCCRKILHHNIQRAGRILVLVPVMHRHAELELERHDMVLPAVACDFFAEGPVVSQEAHADGAAVPAFQHTLALRSSICA